MKFSLGQTVATPGAIEAFDPEFFNACLTRHLSGDWGEVCDEDKAANDAALKGEGRLLSAYSKDGAKLWIITEWDRSVTTLLLPSEY
jgi:hypothetical protein